MNMSLKKLIVTSLYISVITTLLSCGGAKTPKPGETAPDFSLSSVDGQTYSLSGQKGKLTMVNFWTDNCDICKKEFPMIEKYYKELAGEDLEILAVYIGESKTAPEEFKQNFGISFPILTGGQEVAFGQYNVRATPTNFLINPEGKVIRKIVGFVDKQQIENLLKSLKRHDG
ncbi:redoxin domain-containing protein [Limibacter armeniacum]|uniref:TlpA family protein disulfide reductase n=1 Tax=Limibacter armeniacum TaxID=466084 RepID=UPI002FE5F9C4